MEPPSVKVNGKFMCRINGEFIPIRLDFDLRDKWLDSHSEIFHVPDHYRSYPAICMWVHKYNKKLLAEILELSWRGLATKKQIAEWKAGRRRKKNDLCCSVPIHSWPVLLLMILAKLIPAENGRK